MTAIAVNGKYVTENLHEYSILFVGSSPALYHRGKRVTSPWRIELAHCQPEDKKGSSA